MIIGRGLLGTALSGFDSENYLFYVNGVSNSMTSLSALHGRELTEMEEALKKNTDKVFVYFSTIQCNNEHNFCRPYVQHKLMIERLIKSQADRYIIIRSGNLVGKNPWNKTTLFNHLYNSLTNNKPVQIDGNVKRNILDVEDFISMVSTYLKNSNSFNKTVDIVNPSSHTMNEIIAAFESVFNKEFIRCKEVGLFPQYKMAPEISLDLIKQSLPESEYYLLTLIRKYYN